uniref:SSXT domain-containing protein n=1 Tax=Syphacia muris TaxID=451379 RepID=A0A0N5AGR6_9BILA
MSLAFESAAQAGARKDAGTIQKMLDENAVLIQTIVKHQRTGRVKDALRYQQLLHRNLIYLASLSDEAALKEELDAANCVGSANTSAPAATLTPGNVGMPVPVGTNGGRMTTATTTPIIEK